MSHPLLFVTIYINICTDIDCLLYCTYHADMDFTDDIKKPIRRSPLRRLSGRLMYRCARHVHWFTHRRMYARTRSVEPLPHLCAEHAPPLIRHIRSYDLWLQRNKIVNLRIAVGRINGIVLNPGEVFSFWRLVGSPAPRKGYLPGMVLRDGAIVPGIGGGLCQLSNLIYWMTLHTPLTVTERYRHSYDVFPDVERSQPFGSGATVAYNYRDLCIRNTTGRPWQLVLGLTDTELRGEWRSSLPQEHTYQVYEAAHWFSRAWWGASLRHNRIARRIYSPDGALCRDEKLVENHALMLYDPYLESGVEWERAE